MMARLHARLTGMVVIWGDECKPMANAKKKIKLTE